jgi:hypothetical protein
MRGIRSIRHGWLFGAALALGGLTQVASAGPDEVLRPQRPAQGCETLARHGEVQLERLPWLTNVVTTHVGAGRPVAITNAYVKSSDLLTVDVTGRVTAFARRDMSPRWMWTLNGAVQRAKPPAEGSGHYVFLTRGPSGQAILEALSRRTGVPAAGFPAYLPYAPSGGVAAGTSMVWVASMGSPRDNKTLTSLELATGGPGWGWHTTSLVMGDPVLDPTGSTLIVASEDGVVMALPATASVPDEPAWSRGRLGTISTSPAVTPEHVIVASHDGLVRTFDLKSGEILWMKSVGQAVRSNPWVLGGLVTEERSTGVEGAPTIKVEVYRGLVFVRNVSGLHAFDLQTGEPQFSDPKGSRSRPLARQGKWVLIVDEDRRVTLRDASDGFKPKATLDLGMFDLLPMNPYDGTIYGVTADGGLVAAVPR